MADEIARVVSCPWCGTIDPERRGQFWCCVKPECLAFWLAWDEKDKRWLKLMHIDPEA